MNLFAHDTKAKPVLKWAGGKSGPLVQLIEYFPPRFTRYVEPFVGGAAVFLSLDPKVPAVINDSNADLIELYRVVRDVPSDLMTELDKLATKYSEEFFYRVRAEMPKNTIKRAARMVFLNKTGFNGLYRLNSKGKFNVPFGKRVKCPALYKKENLLSVSARLRSSEIYNSDFEKVIDESGAGDFIYCDPPYEPLSTTSSFTSYTASGFPREAQQRLRDACGRAVVRGAVVAISNSSAPFIKNLFRSWDVRYISAKRAINSKGNQRGEIDEVLAILGYTPTKVIAPVQPNYTLMERIISGDRPLGNTESF